MAVKKEYFLDFFITKLQYHSWHFLLGCATNQTYFLLQWQFLMSISSCFLYFSDISLRLRAVAVSFINQISHSSPGYPGFSLQGKSCIRDAAVHDSLVGNTLINGQNLPLTFEPLAVRIDLRPVFHFLGIFKKRNGLEIYDRAQCFEHSTVQQ